MLSALFATGSSNSRACSRTSRLVMSPRGYTMRRGRMQLAPHRPIHDARVVARGELVETQLDYSRQHQVETDECVAAHAWVGRPAGQVGAVKGLDHPLAELLLPVPAVIRNVEERGDATCVLHGVQRTATAVARGLFRVAARPLLQRDADDFVTPRLQERRGHGRIDAT